MIVKSSIILNDPNSSIQDAIDALPSGGTIYLGPGSWGMTELLTVPDFITLQGAGIDVTVLSWQGVTALKDSTLISVQGNHCAIRDLTIIGFEPDLTYTGTTLDDPAVSPGTSTNAQVGVKLAAPDVVNGFGYNVNNFDMRRVFIRCVSRHCVVVGQNAANRPVTGVTSLGLLSTFDQCWFQVCRNAETSNANVVVIADSTTIHFSNCYIQMAHNSAVYTDNSNGLTFTHCSFEDLGFDNIDFILLGGAGHGVRFQSCWFEKHGIWATRYFIRSNGGNYGLVVRDCLFWQDDTVETKAHILWAFGTTSGGQPVTLRAKFADNECRLGGSGAPDSSEAFNLSAAGDAVLSDSNVTANVLYGGGEASRPAWAAVGAGTLTVLAYP